jgi:hypothetical protein
MGEANRRGSFESRKQLIQEAQAARQWLLNNPAPKQSNHFLPFSDVPYLPLTDELYAHLVNSGNFDNMPKLEFDYLASQNFSYDVANNIFVVNQDKIFQPFDLKDNLSNGEALVKTCEMFGDLAGEVFLGDDIRAAVDAGQSVKDFLEYDEKKRKQKRIKPVIKAATDFYVLKELREIQDGKKSKRCEDLKLLDFNGTDFKEVRSIDTETGELLTFTVRGKGKKRKFILQSSMSKIQDRFSMRKVMAKLLPEYRVSKCGCVVQSNAHGVSVFKSRAHNSISCSNVQTCTSVWHDPVCAAKITERRRFEVNKGISIHKLNGGRITFVTRTIPHTKADSLVSLRDRFRKADAYMKEFYQYKKMRSRFKVYGDIKVFELTVTWLNGWHFHVHEVFLHDADAFEGEALESNPAYAAFLKDFESTYYGIWRDMAVKAGFDTPSREHGLQVQNGDFAAEYIAKWGCEPESKWGVDSELTKAHIKNSRKGYTPWALIRLYRDTGDERLIPIIQEYAHSMHRQQQLIWSTGLKKKLGINEITDDEIAAEIEDDAEEIGVLSPVQFKFIVKNDILIDFYLFAAQGWDVLTNFLHSFDGYPRVFSLEAIPQNS